MKEIGEFGRKKLLFENKQIFNKKLNKDDFFDQLLEFKKLRFRDENDNLKFNVWKPGKKVRWDRAFEERKPLHVPAVELEKSKTDPRVEKIKVPDWHGIQPEAPIINEKRRVRITPGDDLDVFWKLVKEVPQVSDGQLNYILTGGFAVQLLVDASKGKSRKDHHDVDFIVFSDKRYYDDWRDGNYVCAMFFDEETVAREFTTKVELDRGWDGDSKFKGVFPFAIPVSVHREIYVTRPEFIIISKLIGFGRPPRGKDIMDIRDMLEYCDIDAEKLKKVVELARFHTSPTSKPDFIASNLIEINKLPFKERAKALTFLARMVNQDQILQADKRRVA